MKLLTNRGQLSFDLGFAIILVLVISGVVVGYWQTSQASVETGRKLMALNMIADYVQGNLNSFYNSLTTDSNVSYSLRMLDEYLFEYETDNDYRIGYVADLSGDPIEFEDAKDAENVQERKLGFNIDCDSGSLPDSAIPGEVIRFKECKLLGSSLSCESCQTT